MQIVASSGKTFNADWVLEPKTRNGVQQLTIQLAGDADPVEILSELVGQAQIIGVSEAGSRTPYERYKKFRSLILSPDGNALRLTLERDDAA